MFENLKKKLKKAIFKIAKKVEEPEPEAVEEIAEHEEEAPLEEAEEKVEEIEEEIKEEAEAEAKVEEVLEEAEPSEPEEEKVEEVVEEVLEEEEPEEKEEPAEEPEKEEVPKEEPEEEAEEPEKEEKPTPAPKPPVPKEEPEEEEKEEPEPELPEEGLEEELEEIKEEAEDIEKETEKEPKKEGFFKKLFRKKKAPKPPEKKPKPPKKEPKPKKKRKTLLERLSRKKISEKNLDQILWDLELALLENDVAKEVTESICSEVKDQIMSSETSTKSVEDIITSSLKNSIEKILTKQKLDVLQMIKEKPDKPFVIVFFGFNGTGKTMTLGKFAKLLNDNNISCVMAAGDTFRAAAIEQLEIHANNLNVPIIKQKRGSDSAAVVYDAIEHAKSKGIDVVLADTAGRSHTNLNLMDELKKVVKVSKPDMKIFVGDALTGNDAADQAKVFHEAVGIDASVLTKVDCDAKGGACLSVSYVTDSPIIFFGTGQEYVDMIPFEAKWFLEKVF